MNVITLDFETYYDKDFSLSKIPTWKYVRDSQFETLMMGYKVNDSETKCAVGDSEVRSIISSLDLENSVVVAHNAYFDCSILAERYGAHPKFMVCTLGLARALGIHAVVGGSLAKLAAHFASCGHPIPAKGDEVVNALGLRLRDFSPEQLERYKSYCMTDVDITFSLFCIMMENFPAQEVVHMTNVIRLGTRALLELDTELLNQHLKEVKENRDNVLMGSQLVLTELRSNPKLAEWLYSKGVTPPTKISKTTGKSTFAFAKTDKEFTDLLTHDDEEVVAVVAARLGVKTSIEETRTQIFLDVAKTGRLPVPSVYYSAHTGRIGGTDKLNLANLPRGGTLRKAIRAPEGMVIGVVDSSQIEARLTAYCAKQQDLIEAFRRKEDVYAKKATEIYGYEVTEETHPDERFVGKVAVLSGGYGSGGVTFANMVRVQSKGKRVMTEEEGHNIIRAYRQSVPSIVEFWGLCDSAIEHMQAGLQRSLVTNTAGETLVYTDKNSLVMPNGMRLIYTNLRREKYTDDDDRQRTGWFFDQRKGRGVVRSGLWGGTVTENVMQSLARIVISDQWAVIEARYPVVQHVYDEIGAVWWKEAADEMLQFMTDTMRTPPAWAPDFPVWAKGSYSESYGDAK